LLRKELDRWPGKVAVIGIGHGKFTPDEQTSLKDAKSKVKIDWPIALDENGTYVKSLYPPNTPQWSYVFIDKSGKRRDEKIVNLEQVSTIIQRLVNEK
jgi:hypothetical protein